MKQRLDRLIQALVFVRLGQQHNDWLTLGLSLRDRVSVWHKQLLVHFQLVRFIVFHHLSLQLGLRDRVRQRVRFVLCNGLCNSYAHAL